jgi:hypothetical protein
MRLRRKLVVALREGYAPRGDTIGVIAPLFGDEFMPPTSGDLPFCSFCGKSQDDVAKLIANPSSISARVYICDECIFFCHSILSHLKLEKPFERGQ